MDAMFRMTPPPFCFHVADRRQKAVVEALHVDPKDAVEIRFCRVFQRADVRHACVIHQDVDLPLRGNGFELRFDLRLIGDIAGVGRGLSAGGFYLLCHKLRRILVYVQHANKGPAGREPQRDGFANAASSSGYYCRFAIKPKSRRPRDRHKTTSHGKLKVLLKLITLRIKSPKL